MNILNAYAGIGGNRKLWGDSHEITAIEFDEHVAEIYKDNFPSDNVIVTDAHQYILDNYKEFDFIWTSPPCPTHSILNTTSNGLGRKMEYPDIQLYQQIIFLKHWFKGKWVVENVVPYYEPLIQPNRKIDRHMWWCNFGLSSANIKRPFKMDTATIKQYQDYLGFDLAKYPKVNKRKCLRNCVIPETGLHILNCAIDNIKDKPGQQTQLFA